ncbi:MAG TPA: hypothetical protein VG982_00670 [Candidatus Paceibacterota bacterium]|nr:hypothetical protein [Candidatus Paceibacterota bacterium]
MPDEIDHIEELQKHLYARNPDSIPKQKYGILHPIRQNVTSTWGQKNIPKNKAPRRINISGYKRFFFFSLIFFLVAGGLAAFSVFRGAVTISSKNVDLSILGNSFVAAGEELPIQVEIVNKNAEDLVNASLTLDYPKGATDETGSEVTHLVQQLGTIGSGKTKSVGFTVVLYGEQGVVRTINATLNYHLAASTATFQKAGSFAVTINASPILLTVDAPPTVAANQTFTLSVRSLFTGDQPLQNAIIRVEYPTGYVFESASPAPSANNNVWSLGDFAKGAEQTIAIKGKLDGLEGDERAFRIYLGSPVSDTDNHIDVAYNSVLNTVTIEQPFITADISANQADTDIIAIPIGSQITGAISWKNTTAYTVSRPTFTLSFDGTSIDQSSIKADNAYISELDHTITWNANSDPALASIDPGQTGNFTFSFAPLSTDHSDVTLSLSVDGTIPDLENQEKTITDLDQKVIRFASHVQFAAQSTYSIGPIKNTGPFPPKANQETSYTITWTVRPTDNPLANVVATATLPQGVAWAGVVSPQTENVTYNPDTQTVTWNAGSLPKATNVPLSRSVSFQVTFRPSTSDVGLEPTLLSETSISADDAVANTTITATRPALTTRLATDPIYTIGAEKVLP